jgi:hypothetical protein
MCHEKCCIYLLAKIYVLHYIACIISCFSWLVFLFTAWGNGDPHIRTLDGLTYDYNGIGEYWLIKSTSFSMQARTIQALSSNGAAVNAGYYGAMAVMDVNSKRLHVELNSTRDGGCEQ